MKKVAIIGSPSLHKNYQSALENVSCQAVIFPDTSYIQKHPEAFDGLLLPGGGDVPASLSDYGSLTETFPACSCNSTNSFVIRGCKVSDAAVGSSAFLLRNNPAVSDSFADCPLSCSHRASDPDAHSPLPSRRGNSDASVSFLPEPYLDLEQLQALDLFFEMKKPIFGICKGMQLINLYLGGTIREVSNESLHRHPGKDTFHPADNLPGSFLHALFGPHMLLNSCHHQCIGVPGKDLQVIQSAQNKTAEAVSHLSLPIIGTQWHPERMPKLPRQDAALLFRYFVSLL